jgi:poly-gamma-glutamate synthesis protein (capsule biosynthesis protein)
MSSRLKTSLLIALFFTGVLLIAQKEPGKSHYESALESVGLAQAPARLLFVGDMMFDRTIRNIAEAKGYAHPFSCAKEYLTSFDVVVGNLEGSITEYKSYSLGTKPGEPGNTTFTFSPKIVPELFAHKFLVLNVGNNHTHDFGRSGASSTATYLENGGIAHFGFPGGEISKTVDVNGKQITFINYNQFLGQDDPQKTKEEIWKAKRKSDFIVIYTHWGEEYVPAGEYAKALAHSFIDAGADMVIGSHPHVVQEHEIYNGKHIFYSLGNFIFDQYWMDEVSTGLGVEVILDGSDIAVKEREFKILRDGRTCLVGGAEIFE